MERAKLVRIAELAKDVPAEHMGDFSTCAIGAGRDDGVLKARHHQGNRYELGLSDDEFDMLFVEPSIPLPGSVCARLIRAFLAATAMG